MMHKRDTWIDGIAALPLFQDCKKRELHEITALTTQIDVPAGRVLCQEGRTGREAFVVLAGTAAVTVAGDDVVTIGPGGFFGEIALLDDGARVATVTAATDMRLLVLTRREFTVLLDDVPTVSRRMLAAMATKLRSASTQVHPSELPV